jgi:hypothetical protein
LIRLIKYFTELKKWLFAWKSETKQKTVKGEKLREVAVDNLDGLHTLEESIRKQSLDHLNQDSRLHEHYAMSAISINIIHTFAITHQKISEDELTIQKLGLRLFNNGSTAIKLGLAGYYQRALDIIRDNIELYFLLDYFLTWPEQISVWSKTSSKERKLNFSPIKIREALDSRDKFTEKKRYETYSIFSEYATHASFDGFKLLVSKVTNLHNIGPFFDVALLDTTMCELARHQCYAAAVFTLHFPNTTKEISDGKDGFFLYAHDWRVKHNAPLKYE